MMTSYYPPVPMPDEQYREHIFQRLLAMARDPRWRDYARAMCDELEADDEFGWYAGLTERVRAALNKREALK